VREALYYGAHNNALSKCRLWGFDVLSSVDCFERGVVSVHNTHMAIPDWAKYKSKIISNVVCHVRVVDMEADDYRISPVCLSTSEQLMLAFNSRKPRAVPPFCQPIINTYMQRQLPPGICFPRNILIFSNSLQDSRDFLTKCIIGRSWQHFISTNKLGLARRFIDQFKQGCR
jgi:hypothetical protein